MFLQGCVGTGWNNGSDKLGITFQRCSNLRQIFKMESRIDKEEDLIDISGI